MDFFISNTFWGQCNFFWTSLYLCRKKQKELCNHVHVLFLIFYSRHDTKLKYKLDKTGLDWKELEIEVQYLHNFQNLPDFAGFAKICKIGFCKILEDHIGQPCSLEDQEGLHDLLFDQMGDRKTKKNDLQGCAYLEQNLLLVYDLRYD